MARFKKQTITSIIAIHKASMDELYITQGIKSMFGSAKLLQRFK